MYVFTGKGGLGNNWGIGFAEKDVQGRSGGCMRVLWGGGLRKRGITRMQDLLQLAEIQNNTGQRERTLFLSH